MSDLTTEQLLYLLYAFAYLDEDDTVRKSTVKPYLPVADREKSDTIYEWLQEEGLIKFARKGRFSITEAGEEILRLNLGKTDYAFTSTKGPKVLNALLTCIKQALGEFPKHEIEFDEFQNKFKEFYTEERKAQSLQGVAIVRKRELAKKFIDQQLLSRKGFDTFFDKLKSQGDISVTEGRDDELIEWVD